MPRNHATHHIEDAPLNPDANPAQVVSDLMGKPGSGLPDALMRRVWRAMHDKSSAMREAQALIKAMLEAGQAKQVGDITRKVLLSQEAVSFKDFEVPGRTRTQDPDAIMNPLPQSRAMTISLRGSLEVITPLSKGAYGEVFLVRKVVSQDVYAMKASPHPKPWTKAW